MRLLILDNYDSFTYNIVHCVRSLGYEAEVRRNDEISIAEIDAFDKIIISPGPGIPSEAGILPRQKVDIWRVPRTSGHCRTFRCSII